MSSFSILHITDAHFGQNDMDGRWPSLKAQFLYDLRHLIQETGPVGLVAFTGDIANRGLATEYDEASRFIDELGDLFLEEEVALPPFAVVPGNHDVARPSEASITKRVLERYWDAENEELMFAGSATNELRDYTRAMFEHYSDWINKPGHALPPVSVSHYGVLPGDFAATEVSGDLKVGIVGLNSTFRHISDLATEGSLTLAPRQINQAAGGDLPKWTLEHDITIALTHHPLSWIQARDDAEDALFNSASTTRIHLCGHLHLEKYTSRAIGTEGQRITHQGQSLFGLEKFVGPEGELLDRQHGYAIINIEKSADGIHASIWPRRAQRLNDGTWNFDRHTGFGLPKGQNQSRATHLPTPSARKPNTPAAINQTRSATADPLENVNITDHVPAFLTEMKKGSMAVVVGDRFNSPDSNHLFFGSFRTALWDSLASGEPDDLSLTTDQVMNLSVEKSRAAAELLVKEKLANPDAATVTELNNIISGPWSAVFYLSPLRDLESCALLEQDHAVCIDSTEAAYRLPPSTKTLILKLAGSIPTEGTSRLLLDERLSRAPQNSFADWRGYASQTLARSPTLFLTDSVTSLSFWDWISDRDPTEASDSYRMPAYLVCPAVPRQYIPLLARYDVKWIKMKVGEFTRKFLNTSREEYTVGRATLARRRRNLGAQTAISVASLSSNSPKGSREYLLGRSPDWGDITGGIATKLDSQRRISLLLTGAKPRSIYLVTGTAGSGRTTALMQCALELQGLHKNVAWIDSAISRSKVSEIVDQVIEEGHDYVFVDDIDVFGAEAERLLQELRGGEKSNRVVVAGARSVRAFLVSDTPFTDKLEMGKLTSSDLDSLVRVLRKNRATADKRISDSQLRDLLQDAGGQLIVGMIQATSGVPFGQKISSECSQLSSNALVVYGCVALVTAENFGISVAQLQDAVGGNQHESWRTIKQLENSRLLQRNPHSDLLEVRHRVVAEEVRSYLARIGALAPVARGTLRAFAAAAAGTTDRADPARRTMIRLLNHSYLIRSLGLSEDHIRSIYDEVESILDSDFHYWLQRGSFEVEKGDLTNAMHDLTSANTTSGGENDFKVLTEFSVLRLKVIKNSRSSESIALGLSAIEDLHRVIRERGTGSPHTISVLASFGVPWLLGALIGRTEKEELARETLRLLRLSKPLLRTNDEIAKRVPPAVSSLETLLSEMDSS